MSDNTRRSDDIAAWQEIAHNSANIQSLAARVDRLEISLAATLSRMEQKIDTLGGEIIALQKEMTDMKARFKGGWIVLGVLGTIFVTSVNLLIRYMAK